MLKAKTPKLKSDASLKGGGAILAGIITVFMLGGIAYGVKIYFDNKSEEMNHNIKVDN